MRYALIDNNIIKVGPRDWHQRFFLDYLNEQNINFYLPPKYESTESIQITDTVYVVPVEEPIYPEMLPYTEQLAGPYWNVNSTLITGYYGVTDVPIDSAKNSLKEYAAAVRYSVENSIIKITLHETEVTIPTARGEDRDIWFQSLVLLPDTMSQKYKFSAEDKWLTLTKSDIQTIVTAIMMHVQQCFDWEFNIVDRLNLASTKEELNSIYADIKSRSVL